MPMAPTYVFSALTGTLSTIFLLSEKISFLFNFDAVNVDIEQLDHTLFQEN